MPVLAPYGVYRNEFSAFEAICAKCRAGRLKSLGLNMPITLVAFDDPPNRFAVTKVGAIVSDGRFFLDFTRKLEVIRWFGIRNRYFGPAVYLLVPVIHEAQRSGGYVVSVNVRDPYFQDLRKLWRAHFPSGPVTVANEADGLKIIGDFATQFPEDC